MFAGGFAGSNTSLLGLGDEMLVRAEFTKDATLLDTLLEAAQ
jgi:hypothetical protein